LFVGEGYLGAVGLCRFVGGGGEVYFGAGGNFSAETRNIIRNIFWGEIIDLRSWAELFSADVSEIHPVEL